MLVYFVTFSRTPEIHPLVDSYQQRLAHVPDLDLVPHEWLHMTVQAVGFTDEISGPQRDAVHHAVQAELAQIQPAIATFQAVAIHHEAVVMPAQPVDPLIAMRAAIRRGAGSILGADSLDGADHRYRPHITLAYNGADRSSAEVLNVVADVHPRPVTADIRTVDLLDMTRDHRMYQWDHVMSAQLGTARR